MIDLGILVQTLEIFNQYLSTGAVVKDNKLIVPLPDYECSRIPANQLRELVRAGWRFDPEIGWILEDKT